MATKKKLIIDTDAGIDDAQAIFMALKSPDVEVIAITTCHGNTDADQVCCNVLRLLKVAGRMDIPVYRGCNKPILGHMKNASHYHGMDGFGDVPDPEAPDITHAQSEHAVNALIRMTTEFPGELYLVALAPPTNIALALRMDDHLGQKLKACYMMGGNYEGKGNITPSAEFNFHSDPEAAKVVLEELDCPIYLVCWELCLKHSLPWVWYEKFINKNTKTARFLKTIEAQTIRTYYTAAKTYDGADQLAMAAILNHEAVVKEMTSVICVVETSGNHSRGSMIVNWKSAKDGMSDAEKSEKGRAHLIMALNHDVFADMLMRLSD